MKIAITGHTKGIGKSLYDKFEGQGHTVIGFSASTGFDIGDPITIKEILDFSLDCDIFINNAYHPTGQTLLLKAFLSSWNGTDKLIINICSKSALVPAEGEEGVEDIRPWLRKGWMADYIASKKEQNKILRSRIFKNTPRTLNVLTGIVDTNMALIFDSGKLKSPDVADLIYELVEYSDKISIQEIVIDVPGLDWNNVKVFI